MTGETVITQEALQVMQQDSFSKYLLDSTLLLDSIKHFLRGEEKVVERQNLGDGEQAFVEVWKKPKNREPPINEKGYHYIMKNLSPLMDKSTATGNISQETANKLVESVVNTVSEGLVIHYKVFGLSDENEIDAIVDPILNLLLIHYSKSVDMKLVQEIFRTHHVSEVRSLGEKKTEPSMTI